MSRILARLAECRRAFPIAAAVAFLAALLLPVWRITIDAPQYVKTLVVHVYAYPRMSGDYKEIAGLNKYVGFHYPDPVYVEPNFPVHETSIAAPEWMLGPVVFVGLALAAVVVAVAPDESRLKRGLRWLAVGTTTVFVAMFAIIQYRLYQAGHSLDPNAPVVGVDSFTPPVVGTYEVANLTGNAWIGTGGYFIVAGVALLFAGYRLRDSDVTVGHLPRLVRTLPGSVRERITRLPIPPRGH